MDPIQLFISDTTGQKSRQILIKNNWLTKKQKDYLAWEACYKGALFSESTRLHPWGTKGPYVDRNQWIPIFIPSIAKDMVKTLSSYIVGRDKFPCINVTSTSKNLFKNLETPAGYEAGSDEGQQKAQAYALQKFANAVINQVELSAAVRRVLRQLLVKEDAAMVLRFFAGNMYAHVPDRTWSSWEYQEDNPKVLSVYREMYFFTREGEQRKDGQPQEYLFYREITETDWVDQEIPLVEKTANGTGLGDPVVVFNTPHGFGVCPVIIYENTDRQSIYADEVLANIKGYIEYCNDLKAGIAQNMDPQWVALKGEEEGPMPAMPGEEDEAPLERGKLWEIKAKSIQSFSNGTEGYEMALKDCDKQRYEIRASANIIDIPEDNEQSGRALALRLSPQYAAIDDLRGSIEKSLKETVEKLLTCAMTRAGDLSLAEDVPIPTKLEGIKVSLDWGGLMPVTPEIVGQEAENIALIEQAGYMSKKSARAYMLPLVNVEDIEAETRQIEIERQEQEQNAASLAEAAFKTMGGNDG